MSELNEYVGIADDLRVIRQAIADGEVWTTRPVNRALLRVLDAVPPPEERGAIHRPNPTRVEKGRWFRSARLPS